MRHRRMRFSSQRGSRLSLWELIMVVLVTMALAIAGTVVSTCSIGGTGNNDEDGPPTAAGIVMSVAHETVADGEEPAQHARKSLQAHR